MDRKNLIKIINEEVSGYNYLGKDEIDKERELYELVQNKDFQRRFIEDAVAYKDNIKYDVTDTQVSGEHRSSLTFFYSVDVSYIIPEYDDPIRFIISVDGNDITINVDSKKHDENNRWVAPSEDCLITYVDWDKMDVFFSMPDGHYMEGSPFTPDIFKNRQIKERFLRALLGGFIEEVEQCEFSDS